MRSLCRRIKKGRRRNENEKEGRWESPRIGTNCHIATNGGRRPLPSKRVRPNVHHHRRSCGRWFIFIAHEMKVAEAQQRVCHPRPPSRQAAFGGGDGTHRQLLRVPLQALNPSCRLLEWGRGEGMQDRRRDMPPPRRSGKKRGPKKDNNKTHTTHNLQNTRQSVNRTRM
ncbi:hypothetical protein LZ31DRAFT_66357 [Colletotrichum somersetense]|nr:hypothetical protein LZ31DRAFT_66357 [Colletotrichum somersetense]